MNTNRNNKTMLALAVCLAGIGLSVFLVPRVLQRAKPDSAGDAGSTKAASQSADNTGSNAAVSRTPVSATTNTPSALRPPLKGGAIDVAAEVERIKREIEVGNWEWQMPIHFYGVVLDQNDKPVEGAGVSFGWTTLTNGGHATMSSTSDANGQFNLAGATGKVLGVRVQKKGYYTTKSSRQSFEFARETEPNFHRPDVSQPVVFRLHRKGDGVDLITSAYGVKKDFSFSTGLEGKPLWVDFLNRKTGPDGQMLVVKWGEQKDRSGRYSWGVKFSIPDGGLIEHSDEFPFLAPESGYQPSVEWAFDKASANWQAAMQRTFYFRFGNPPRYGQFKLQTGGLMSVQLDYAVNPDGGRNLEPK